MLYIELENVLKTTNWKVVAEFFDNRIKQEIVDLVANAQQVTPEMLKESQTKIEAWREFMNLPSTIASLNEQARETEQKSVDRRKKE